MKHVFGALAIYITLGICACVPGQNPAVSAANAASDAAYTAAINDCGNKAIAQWKASPQTPTDFIAAHNLYNTCAAGVDAQFGKK